MGELDVCFAPVLNLDELLEHPHNKARSVFIETNGNIQPAPAPRFSRTPGHIQHAPVKPGENNDEVLKKWGFNQSEVNNLRDNSILHDPR